MVPDKQEYSQRRYTKITARVQMGVAGWEPLEPKECRDVGMTEMSDSRPGQLYVMVKRCREVQGGHNISLYAKLSPYPRKNSTKGVIYEPWRRRKKFLWLPTVDS